MNEESELFSKSESSASGCCLAFAYVFCQFHPDVVYKSVAYKKHLVLSGRTLLVSTKNKSSNQK